MGKCSIDLITGFLSSGKTSFIKSFLKTLNSKDEVIVVQCEKGIELLDQKEYNRKKVTFKNFESNDEISEERLIRMIRFYSPNRIIVECNGVGEVKKLIDIINSKALKNYCRLGTVVNMVDVTTLNMFLNNIPSLIMPSMQISNLIILNKSNSISKESITDYVTMIEALNTYSHILICGEKEELYNLPKNNSVVNRLLG